MDYRMLIKINGEREEKTKQKTKTKNVSILGTFLQQYKVKWSSVDACCLVCIVCFCRALAGGCV